MTKDSVGVPERHHQSFWLWVMCLTGVDYFSTLGYQPSIAFNATGLLSPFATIVLVAVTLGCALPVYRYVAEESPHGQGSIAMLEALLGGWAAKFLVLVLLGFAATDFVITKTLSAADAAVHLIHNPLWSGVPPWLQGQMVLTMLLLVLLGAVFLRGFREVIGVAVVVVGAYLVLNAIVITAGLWRIVTHGEVITRWLTAIGDGQWHMEGNWSGQGGLGMIALACLLYFPKLALGLSGFETGVAVMPLIRGDVGDAAQRPAGRIRNTRKLLLTAAVIMSAMLLGSSLVICTLIEPAAMEKGGVAANRALAYLAHGEGTAPLSPVFGETFGTIYDVTSVLILWFAGASAMSGLLSLVPRYLPRYGMAPRWAEAFRPMVVLFTCVGLLVTWLFDASVEAQGGAYATGVMVLITSACVAVLIDQLRKRAKAAPVLGKDAGVLRRLAAVLDRVPWTYVLITVVFLYTTVAIVVEKPDGIKIAGAFIVAVIAVSMFSRTRRSTELRFEEFDFVDQTSRMLWDTLKFLEFPVLVPHRPGGQSIVAKDEQIRRAHRLGADEPIVFIEATLEDPSQFEHRPLMEITQSEGRFIIRLNRCASIAHAVATIALELSKTGKPPEVHFGWSDHSPLAANLSFIIFGEGNVPWLVRELILKAEPDPEKRPRVIIG
jgi:hypothetical protein